MDVGPDVGIGLLLGGAAKRGAKWEKLRLVGRFLAMFLVLHGIKRISKSSCLSEKGIRKSPAPIFVQLVGPMSPSLDQASKLCKDQD